jgi:hypothetical protein
LRKGNKVTRIGIGIITGRKNFINVLRMNYNDWKETGLLNNPNIEIELFIAYDLEFGSLLEKDFKKIPKEILDGINNVHLIGGAELKEMILEIHQDTGEPISNLDLIFGNHGYAKLRNSVLYCALKNKIDYLLYLDDDEYPLKVEKKSDGTLKWSKQHTLLTHLKHIQKCDITYGYKCGYVAPIPYFDIKNQIDEKTLSTFINAMKNNDTSNWDELKSIVVDDKGITYGESPKVFEREYENGGKYIWGTNLCLNLKSLGNNLPPFYNPLDARGEDGFFSTGLKDAKVLRIPVYNFHDPFLEYPDIVNGILPTEIFVHQTDEKSIKRFFATCVGWMRYKPLLLYISDRKTFGKKIQELYKQLDSSLTEISTVLQKEEFMTLKSEAEKYVGNVFKDYAEFNKVKEVWKRTIQNCNTISDEEDEIEEKLSTV